MKQEIRCLILVGGLGTRLLNVVDDRPKPMALIDGRPFLDYLLEYLVLNGFYKFSLLVGHKSKFIIEYYKAQKKYKNIDFIVEEFPLGTGGAIKNGIKEYDNEDEFLILNGDTLFTIDFLKFLSETNGLIKLALSTQLDTSRYGTVQCRDGKVTSFVEKSDCHNCGEINGGVVWFKKDAIPLLSKDKFSFEEDVIRPLVKKGLVYGEICFGDFIDIGTPEDYETAKTLIPKWINFNNK